MLLFKGKISACENRPQHQRQQEVRAKDDGDGDAFGGVVKEVAEEVVHGVSGRQAVRISPFEDSR